MRLFIGIKIDDKAKKKINSYFNLFYENKIRGNYSKLSNLHMTLAFLGEVSEDKVPLLKKIIKGINIDINELHLSKIAKLRDVLVCEVEKNDKLEKIYNDLFKALKASGFNIDNREWHPHVTLVRKVENGDKYLNVDMNIVSYFDKITLFESKRIDNELVYIDLGEWNG